MVKKVEQHPALTEFYLQLTAIVGRVAHNPDIPLANIAKILEEKASYLRSLDIE